MTQPAGLKSARVLVVDDEPGILEFVDRALRGAGHRTRTAGNGLEAIDLAASDGPFDLLLTDMRMPEITGDELARRIRQHQPEMKVLYLTGYCDQLFIEKGALWEGEAFLEKPTSANALLQAVSLLLYGSTATIPAAK